MFQQWQHKIYRRTSRFALVILVLMTSSCIRPPAATVDSFAAFDAQVSTTWFELQLQLVEETPGFSPPVASRAFGYTGVALYEAIVPGMTGYQSLAGQLNELPVLPAIDPALEYDWPTVANAALAEITRQFFATASPENLQAVTALEKYWVDQYQPALNPAVMTRSILQGRLVAAAIYAWSRTDGIANDKIAYTSPSGDGLWLPTPPKNLAALLPRWGDHRPFVRAEAACPAAPPPTYSTEPTSIFYTEAREVYDAGVNLTPDQRAIALFWADNAGETVTPPGHSISILTQVLRHKQASLGEAAVAYAKVGIAIADAFITCWQTKYEYNLLRPITYIQTVIDPNWMPELPTPPFPEYTSGHSVQSAATAAVLTDLFGENYAFTDHTHDAHGIPPRSFRSFWDAAEEAAISRLYGGIHYRAAIEEGITQGKCVGARVNALKFMKG